MTNKEFEDKKQELLDIEIRAEFGYVDHDNLSVLHEKIKQLQPPRPTCDTCKYINLECDSNTYGGFLCKNINALNADGDAVSTSGGYNIITGAN
ncbi:MAG: hypothetical protein K2Q03_01840 [Sphingobacteriaceae bacterium]|nr:hypothetical protein [Sphingobacteriaceae bacterium]